jgi:hypothetical protein
LGGKVRHDRVVCERRAERESEETAPCQNDAESAFNCR